MKMFVAGCSFSDYKAGRYVKNVDSTYGHFLSENLNLPYTHLAMGEGSNYRIWRKIIDEIKNKNLTSDDLLIVQYTDFSRREFFSNFMLSDDCNYNFLKEMDEAQNKHSKHLFTYEKWGDGRIIKFKIRPDEYYKNNIANFTKEENQFSFLYQNYFLDNKFLKEEFNYHHFMFENMLLNLKIKTVFLFTSYMHDTQIELSETFKKSAFNAMDFTNNLQYRRELWDIGHLNQLGHEILANLLKEHLKKINYI